MATQPVRRANRRTRQRSAIPLDAHSPSDSICLEAQDNSLLRRSAVQFFGLHQLRDPHPTAARLADQFVRQNEPLLARMQTRISHEFDGSDVILTIRTGNTVGALPLLSPTTAKPDFGLVVQPRFPWAGVGSILAQMGWRIVPTALRLPLLRRSERKVPAWVLSSMVITRLKALLDSLDRRFEIVREPLRSPRGAIHWPEYACRSLPSGNPLAVPCVFPDLRNDRELLGAVRFTVERHLRSLEAQRAKAPFLRTMIEAGEGILRRVQSVPPLVPSPPVRRAWLQRPLRSEHVEAGLRAIEWTVEERGLAGLSDLEGLPWTLAMEEFFEAWVETVWGAVARQTGGRMKVGRTRATLHPLRWEPPSSGSQGSLIPDVWLEWDRTTLIIDAKYKRHWEELGRHGWTNLERELRDSHRQDLLQVLAYANLSQTALTVACLAYPCSAEAWRESRTRARLISKAELGLGARTVQVWLTAIPMDLAADEISAELARTVRDLGARALP